MKYTLKDYALLVFLAWAMFLSGWVAKEVTAVYGIEKIISE